MRRGTSPKPPWFYRVKIVPAPYGLPKPCRLWTGGKHERGYGRLRDGGRVRAAHRVAYEYATGEKLPDEVMVLHRCDRQACIEETHLYRGTAVENYRAMSERGRAVGNRKPRSIAECDRAITRLRGEVATATRKLRAAKARRLYLEERT